jgi:hypothetical protein
MASLRDKWGSIDAFNARFRLIPEKATYISKDGFRLDILGDSINLRLGSGLAASGKIDRETGKVSLSSNWLSGELIEVWNEYLGALEVL